MDDRGDEDGGSFLEGVCAPALATIVAPSASSILVVDVEMNGVKVGARCCSATQNTTSSLIKHHPETSDMQLGD